MGNRHGMEFCVLLFLDPLTTSNDWNMFSATKNKVETDKLKVEVNIGFLNTQTHADTVNFVLLLSIFLFVCANYAFFCILKRINAK